MRVIHEDYDYGILLDIQSVNRKVGDNDNIAKGIHDALEDGGYIYDDRYALDTMQFKSFGHEANKCIVYLWEKDYTPARRKELKRLKLLKTVNEPVIITEELLERDRQLRKSV